MAKVKEDKPARRSFLKWFADVTEKVVLFLYLWLARAGLALLSIAGMLYFLGGIDDMIRYPVAIVTTAFLLKEVL